VRWVWRGDSGDSSPLVSPGGLRRASSYTSLRRSIRTDEGVLPSRKEGLCADEGYPPLSGEVRRWQLPRP